MFLVLIGILTSLMADADPGTNDSRWNSLYNIPGAACVQMLVNNESDKIKPASSLLN